VKRKKTKKLSAEFWARDAAARRELERLVADSYARSRTPPDERLLPPQR
jgi:hypothetical protein